MKKSKKEKNYFVIVDNYYGTDSEAKILQLTKKQILMYDWQGGDFAIIDGELIKNFDSKFDSGRLK